MWMASLALPLLLSCANAAMPGFGFPTPSPLGFYSPTTNFYSSSSVPQPAGPPTPYDNLGPYPESWTLYSQMFDADGDFAFMNVQRDEINFDSYKWEIADRIGRVYGLNYSNVWIKDIWTDYPPDYPELQLCVVQLGFNFTSNHKPSVAMMMQRITQEPPFSLQTATKIEEEFSNSTRDKIRVMKFGRTPYMWSMNMAQDGDIEILPLSYVQFSLNHKWPAAFGYLRIQDNFMHKSVCGDSWTVENTQVACRQMGFAYGVFLGLGPDPTFPGQMVNQGEDVLNTKFSCNGDEDSLGNCPQNPTTLCNGNDHSFDVFLWCSYTEPSNEDGVTLFLAPAHWSDLHTGIVLLNGGGGMFMTLCKPDIHGLVMDGETINENVFCDGATHRMGLTASYASVIASDYGVGNLAIMSFNATMHPMQPTCTNHNDDVAVTCTDPTGATCYPHSKPADGIYEHCIHDYDCCSGTCYNFNCLSFARQNNYIGCYSDDECASNLCRNPGHSGLCTVNDANTVACRAQGMGCSSDADCCNNNINGCTRDLFCFPVGPFRVDFVMYQADMMFDFLFLNGETINSGTSVTFEFRGDFGRDIDIKIDTVCSGNSITSAVPGGEAIPASYRYDMETKYHLGSFIFWNTGIINNAKICYRWNSMSNWQSTGAQAQFTIGVSNAFTFGPPLIVEWVLGSFNFSETNQSYANGPPNQRLQFRIKIDPTTPLGFGDYVELNTMVSVTPMNCQLYPRGFCPWVSYDWTGNPSLYRDHNSWTTPWVFYFEYQLDHTPSLRDPLEIQVQHTWMSGTYQNGNIQFNTPAKTMILRMADTLPTLRSNSLRRQGEQRSAHVQGQLLQNEDLAFDCYECDVGNEFLTLTYGPVGAYDYHKVDPTTIELLPQYDNFGEFTSGVIRFRTAGFRDGIADDLTQNLHFQLTVTSPFNASRSVTLLSDFTFSYPAASAANRPIITDVKGDGCQKEFASAVNCPTDGLMRANGSIIINETTGLGIPARVLIKGIKFPDASSIQSNLSLEVNIDGVPCTGIIYTGITDSNGERNISCEYGSGVSPIEEKSNVVIRYFIEGNGFFEQGESFPAPYFNRSWPKVQNVTGCTAVSHIETVNCSRNAANTKIQVYGENFGTSGARVFLSGQQCLETQHDFDDPHGHVTCTPPPGTTINKEVWVMNSRGGMTPSSGMGLMSYTQCDPGMRQAPPQNPPDVNCYPCLQGTFSNQANAPGCTPCGPGEYAPTNRSTECLSCSPGSFSLQIGSSNCTQCTPGHYQSLPAQTECLLCPPGKFASSPSATSCTDCEVGTFAVAPGSSVCAPCPAGKYSDRGATECTQCGVRDIAPLEGANRCARCLINSSPNTDRTACLADIGYYMHGNETDLDTGFSVIQVTQCGEGMDCTEVGLTWQTVLPIPGYMPRINTQPETISMMPCINNACVGGKNGHCADGFEGVLCTECREGLGKKAGHQCETCLPPAQNVARLAGIFLLVCVIMVGFIYQTIVSAESGASDLSTIGKIGFSFLQFNSLALQFDFQFPDVVDQFLEIQQQPAQIANGILSVDCFVKDSEHVTVPSIYVKSIAYLGLPLFVLLACRLTFVKFCLKKTTAHEVDRTMSPSRKSLKKLVTMDLPQDSRMATFVRAHNNYMTAVIITLFMVHPSIVQQTFAMFNCKQLGANVDDWFLIEDMSLRCWTPSHYSWVFLVAVPMLILYVFGMPFGVFIALYQNREELLKEDFRSINVNVVQKYHFLFKGYEPNFYYWEIFIMIRKVAMVSIAVFFSYNIQIQSLLATLLVVVSMCVHAFACPFNSDAMDGLELLSLFGSFCTYFFGQFLFVEVLDNTARLIISFIIVLSNTTVMVIIVLMLFGMLRKMVENFGRKVRNVLCCGQRGEEEEEPKNFRPRHSHVDQFGHVKTRKSRPSADLEKDRDRVEVIEAATRVEVQQQPDEGLLYSQAQPSPLSPVQSYDYQPQMQQ